MPPGNVQISCTSFRFVNHIVGGIQFYHSEVLAPNIIQFWALHWRLYTCSTVNCISGSPLDCRWMVGMWKSWFMNRGKKSPIKIYRIFNYECNRRQRKKILKMRRKRLEIMCIIQRLRASLCGENYKSYRDYPNKAVSARIWNLFNDNILHYFSQILRGM